MTPALRSIALTLLASLACLAADDIGRMTAPEILKKSIGTLQAQKGYHFDVAAGVPMMKLEGKGVFVSPDEWYAKQDVQELYCKAKKLAVGVMDGGTWKERSEVDRNVAVKVIEVTNPQAVIETMLKYAKAAKPLPDDTRDHDGKPVIVTGSSGDAGGLGMKAQSPWKVVEVEAPAEEAERLWGLLAGAFPGAGAPNASALDRAKSGVTYRAWINRADFLIWRIEAHYHVAAKSDKIALPLNAVDLRIETYDFCKDLQITPPDAVRKELGWK